LTPAPAQNQSQRQHKRKFSGDEVQESKRARKE
jgi:hypothetical protein